MTQQTALHILALTRAIRRNFGQPVTIRNGQIFDVYNNCIGCSCYRFLSDKPWFRSYITGIEFSWPDWQLLLAGQPPAMIAFPVEL